MTWRELDVEQCNGLKSVLLIDVRSPGEHADERIPNSLNIPLLSDAERAIIGTIYHEQGEISARRQALKLIAPKIPVIVEEILQARKHGQTIIVYCWRGGLRSESVCSVLSIAGVDCFRLTGGYKAWRARTLGDLKRDAFPFDPLVLVGLTGTGKTYLLQALKKRKCKVLDLEELANHRGSIFGGLGLGQQPTQKNFDAQLWKELRQLDGGTIMIEGEGRKIGRISLPDCVLKRIKSGPFILVSGTVEKRAQRIAEDYLQSNSREDVDGMHNLLDLLKDRLGAKRIEELKQMLSNNQILELVTVLLSDYYDPMYRKQIAECASFELSVDSDDIEAAADRIAQWVNKRHRTGVSSPANG
jgi:tRNA 2-selenouridine synthase